MINAAEWSDRAGTVLLIVGVVVGVVVLGLLYSMLKDGARGVEHGFPGGLIGIFGLGATIGVIGWIASSAVLGWVGVAIMGIAVWMFIG
jgi:hypothetical protein